MEEKWYRKYLSRKFIVTLATNLTALYMAFGGNLTDAQATAIIALVNGMYMYTNAKSKPMTTSLKVTN